MVYDPPRAAMVNGLWSSCYDLWFMENLLWFMVYGVAALVYGLLSSCYNLWFMEQLLWFMVYGAAAMVYGL